MGLSQKKPLLDWDEIVKILSDFSFLSEVKYDYNRSRRKNPDDIWDDSTEELQSVEYNLIEHVRWRRNNQYSPLTSVQKKEYKELLETLAKRKTPLFPAHVNYLAQGAYSVFRISQTERDMPGYVSPNRTQYIKTLTRLEKDLPYLRNIVCSHSDLFSDEFRKFKGSHLIVQDIELLCDYVKLLLKCPPKAKKKGPKRVEDVRNCFLDFFVYLYSYGLFTATQSINMISQITQSLGEIPSRADPHYIKNIVERAGYDLLSSWKKKALTR